MRRLLWGVFALCVVAMFVAAVISVAEDLTAPDRSLDRSEVGNCVGFPGQGGTPGTHEDPDAARIVACDSTDARYRVLADGDAGPGPGDPCARFRDTVKVLVIGPMAPTAGRFLCLGRVGGAQRTASPG